MILQPPTLLRRLRHCRSQADSRGFTLVELVIAIGLLGLITSAAMASLLTAVRASSSSSQNALESSDAQLIGAFLVKDAQALGGSNPATGTIDPTLGITFADTAGCAPAGTVKAQFRWLDRSTPSGAPTDNVVSYVLDTASDTLVRRHCVGGIVTSDLTLGRRVAELVASCIPVANCPGLPDLITFTLTETNDPAYAATAFTYDLTAQVRSESQSVPTSLNSGAAPLIALGGATCPPSGSFLNVNGSSSLVVQLGGAIVNGSVPGCNAMSVSGAGSYSSDSTSLLSPGTCSGSCPSPITSFTSPLLNPLAALPVPPNAGACAATVGNPPLTGAGHYQPGVYRNAVSVAPSDTATFDDGTYIFCNGLSVRGTMVAPHVLLYFAGGTLSVNATAIVTLGSQITGTYKNVSAWLTTADDVSINGGGAIDSYKGIVYAPLAVVNISGGTNLQIGSVVAYAVNLVGGGFTTFGPGVTITTAALPPAFVGAPYTITMTAAAGATPYKDWTATGLPAGLTINAVTGELSGTPTAVGTHAITVGVTDSSAVNKTVTRDYTLNVGSGSLTISAPASLFDATLNTAYSTTMTPSGGTGGFTWSAIGLPVGVAIDPVSGVISGIPTATGSYPITIAVTDAAAFSANRSYTLVVNQLPVLTLPALPASTVGASYLATPTVGFGSAPFAWTATNLPAGLTINPTTGALGGSATTAGTTPNVIVTATDRNGASASATRTLVINPAPVISAPTNLPGWAVGSVYPSTALTAAGGTGSLTWSATGLPAGLSIGIGSIGGTPTAPGSTTAIVTVTDSAGVSASRSYPVTITASLAISAPATLTNWQVGVPYPATTLTATGGSAGKTWSAAGLPDGLSIGSLTGVITGTPTTVGTSTPVVTVTDSNGVSAAKTYNTITVFGALAYTGPNALPTWDVGSAYPSQTLTATGGAGGLTWTATNLPPGLSITSAGVLQGSPTGAGTYGNIMFTVTDSLGIELIAGPLSITINPAIVLNTSLVPTAGVQGVPYSGNVSVTGGGGPFTLTATNLPAGITMTPGGALSGIPTSVATSVVTIMAIDNGTGGVGGQRSTATRTVTITVNGPLAWSSPLPGATARTAGFAYTQSFTTSGGLAPVTWSITGLPAGLTSSNGIVSANPALTISGTPTAVGSSTITVTATDALVQSVVTTYVLTVNPTLTLAPSTVPTADIATGAAYTAVTYNTTGGTGAVGLTISGLPAGLTFVQTGPTTGLLSGTPNGAASTNIVTVTATDAGGGTVTSSYTLRIHAKPTGLQLINGAGSASNKMDKGDAIVVTFSEPVTAGNICTGWNGALRNTVLVMVANGTGGVNDTVTLTDPSCTGGLRFGSIDLGSGAYVDSTRTFGANGNANVSTMVLNPAGTSLTITLGRADGTAANYATVNSGTLTATYNPTGGPTAAGLSILTNFAVTRTASPYFF